MPDMVQFLLAVFVVEVVLKRERLYHSATDSANRSSNLVM